MRRRGFLALLLAPLLGAAACGGSGAAPTAAPAPAPSSVGLTIPPPPAPTPPAPSTTAVPTTTAPPAQPRLATDLAVMADQLVADERAIRDPATAPDDLVAAARRQQVAYRALGRNPDWDGVVRPRIPAELLAAYDRNVDARRQFTAMAGPPPSDELPQWRIDPPLPADQLLAYYQEAESITGVGWSYLASINLVETGLGRIVGLSYAGARGPMQFLPSTFAAYGEGNIDAPRDSIIAAGRYLAANGFVDGNVDGALWQYNHSTSYVQAVKDYAEVLAADPAAFAGYYAWDIYYFTSMGDVVLPVGYLAPEPIPVADYLATHPQ